MKKHVRVIAVVMVFLLMFSAVMPFEAMAASKTYKKVGKVFPDIIGLGASDTISFSVDDGKITSVTVSQKGGSCLGVINVKPNGYYMKNSNTLVCKWVLTVSAPFKIFNLEKGIKYKTVEYKLGTNGSATMKIVA